MCLARVYIEEEGQEKEVMQDVAWIGFENDELLMITLLGEEKRFHSKIKSIDLLNSSVVLKGEENAHGDPDGLGRLTPQARGEMNKVGSHVSEEEIRRAVGQVKHPAIDRTLVDLGILKDITVKGSNVTITMVLPFAGIPIKDQLVASVREPIEKLGAEVEVETTVMSEDELPAFLAMEQKSWRGGM
jgi:ATP-binding protein involved in chromosome partitioning